MAFDDYNDFDPQETREWQEAVDVVVERVGPERATYLLHKAVEEAYRTGAEAPDTTRTPYVNTIPPHKEAKLPGDAALLQRLIAYLRWNAMAMVVRANKKPAEPGGHIASYQSSAVMYEVGFNHFWQAPSDGHGGDIIYVQGHCAPGIYARAFLEGRLSEEQLENFRLEVDGKGISSYPHPYLMPDFWQVSTVSMGLGPIMAIYQARFMKYLQNRGLADTEGRKVWAFLGDGEMDEPQSQGAIALASREKLDNLIFVINCNLQRLDGPVRGNGKIVQELEGNFRGAGWNVIKCLWGSGWDELLAKDTQGLLRKRMEECVDGEYQNFKVKGGGYIREHFFGKYPELKEMVAHLSDDDIYYKLIRGGHDPQKVYAAYHAAVNTKDKPSVLLMKTVKGYGMGEGGEGQNITHQKKKLGEDNLRYFQKRFDLPFSDEQVTAAAFIKPPEESAEMQFLHAQRQALGGYLPQRQRNGDRLEAPPLEMFKQVLADTGERTMSTTMAMVRIMVSLARDKTLGPRLTPIVADESRTFGMEGMFRQIGIYAPEGQKYVPMDAEEIMPYREDQKGQILQEGINEDGAMSSWIAAATSYSNHGVTMIPFYIYYSMFGFQRVGDLAWAAGDMLARGFLIGGTSGRTTLNGEGLQHQDGHSQLFAQFIPNCMAYDPTFHYEVAVIVRDGLKRMYEEQQDVFYYITTMNENYHHPALPEGAEEGIIKGMYRFSQAEGKAKAPRVQLLGCGSILNEVIAAVELLRDDWGVAADVWSCPSFNELARDGHAVKRWNRLHPGETPRKSYVEQCLEGTEGPVIASTDYIRMFAEQIRPFVPRRYEVLGTDGFGRSDSREALRRHFEVDRHYVVLTALQALVDEGKLKSAKVRDAIAKYGIDPEKPNPLYA
ncbi:MULTISPECIES: pyruvate dehydrogenase (acetyl-transferring), homodimeric type [Halomonadaceae]|uniref:Pyruvate dehydrogenase E1 component n=1 Tax=Billgrantia aerodenitrificans TaxID=2733483 RepID=A0ABS9AXX0_9GAMM|nr:MULTISPECIES: pyruvate dehydrogenase (acetyl-transferring), homodimeric type [Halomonas]MCE8026758.1 pyruvate dehydrogenase (acetyl-transferring), homodimeric type [Halomonas aerodenitrificans]MCE8039430.1 pyruvate dehydrogenase (acetyl-transferring), homodimeric type [Halomonas sp. MCCC 1A11062]